MQKRFPYTGRTHGNTIQTMLRNSLYNKPKFFSIIFHQMIITLPALAKTMIVANDNSMGAKFLKKKMIYILFRGLLRKFFIKRNYYKMINPFILKQLCFFFECVENENVFM